MPIHGAEAWTGQSAPFFSDVFRHALAVRTIAARFVGSTGRRLVIGVILVIRTLGDPTGSLGRTIDT